MKTEKVSNEAMFVYSLNMLRMLLKMELISKEEYENISRTSADYYGIDWYYV